MRGHFDQMAVQPAQQFTMPLRRWLGDKNLNYFPQAAPGLFEQMRSFRYDQALFGRLACARGAADSLEQRILCAGQSHACSKVHLSSVDLEFQTQSNESAELITLKRAIAGAFVLLSILFLGYLFFVAKQIERQSVKNEAQPADVIIVLGAAEYRGKPSPVLQARLNHALLLYLKGLAPYILTTGGAGGDPVFTEGEVGRAYLTRHGVPSEAIIVEPEGATTAESLDAAAETMRRMGLHSCIVVSDGYHIYRVKRLLQAQGIKVYGSPRPQTGSMSSAELRWMYFRQAVGFVLWQIGINI